MWSSLECLTIAALCGGSGNIESIYNCFTRVHFVLKDDEKITEQKKKRLEKIPYVKGVFIRGGEVQLVVGSQAALFCKSCKKELGK